MRGFMDGHAQWMSDEDHEEVHGAAARNEEEGQQDNNDEGREDDEELPAHDDGDEDQDEQHVEDVDTRTPLTSVVRDPHVQELLLKKTTDARGAAREKSKLAQLEIDSNTLLYAGCGPEESRLRVALDVLQMKAKHRWTDTSVDDCLQYWHNRLPDKNTCPSSLDEAKKVVCPLDLPHVRYHACINDCIIYRNEHADKTICPVCKAARYKKGKKAPRKVVWHFSPIPRLQR